MTQRQTEELYRTLDQASQLLAEDLDTSYLEGLIEICEDLLQQKIQVENDQPSPNVVERLKVMLNGSNLATYDNETIRKAFSLSYLRAVQVDNIQATHHQTPDAIAMIVAYIVSKFVSNHQSISILDPLVGIGNLLSTVVNSLEATGNVNEITGVEIDDALLALAGISFDLQKHPATLIEGDMQTMQLPSVDVVVADVPLLRSNAIKANELIVSASAALNPNGVAVFVVPSTLLENAETVKLLTELTVNNYVQGIIKFAPSTFKNPEAAKALLIVQRHGNQARQASQVLLAQVPALTATEALPQFFTDFDQWIATL